MHPNFERPPRQFWLIPLAVVLLRAIPFLLTQWTPAAPGYVYPPVGYNPIDTFAYVSFIRQTAETGDWLLANSYTTLPQDGRFFSPFFSLLGWLSGTLGADPFWVLEFSRGPLIFLFFRVLWWFLGACLREPRLRMLAVCLVAFSGGIEGAVYATLPLWPAKLHETLLQALSDAQGWNTFASLNNPLWTAGLTFSLVTLRPLFQPSCSRKRARWAQVALGWLATYLVHPYSGLAVLTVVVFLPLVRWLLGAPGTWWRGYAPAGVALLPALAAVAAFSLWQNQDEVYRLTAQRVLGDYQLSVFWYPITLGGLGWLAARGWRAWGPQTGSARVDLAAWILAIAFLHSSPLVNGYHFVFQLHIPICVLAALTLDQRLAAFAEQTSAAQLQTALLLALVFHSCATVTYQSAKRALLYQVPEPAMSALRLLAKEPMGAVYTTPHLGALVPAYTHHQVYVGHWFLTPDHAAKAAACKRLLETGADVQGFLGTIKQEHIRYLLLPPPTPAPVKAAIQPLVERSRELDGYTLAVLRD